MSLGPILEQLEREKKPLVALFLLLGIGIIRPTGPGPKPAETIAFSSNPQTVHRGVGNGRSSAILSDNASIGVAPAEGQGLGPDEELRAYFVAKAALGVFPGADLLAASSQSPDSLPDGAGPGLFAKI